MNRPKNEQDALNLLRQVPPPNPLRQEAARRAYLQQAARLRADHLAPQARRHRPRLSQLRLLIVSVVLALLALAGLGGTAYAADQARPGEALYPLDRSIETLQLRLTRNPQRAASLRLACAEERLAEAESLATSGDETNLTLALDAYTETILSLSPSPDLDQTLARHEMRLHRLWERTSERGRHGLERALDAVGKGYSVPPSKETPPQSAPSFQPTPSTPSDTRHGPPQDRPDKAKTKTPHRPEDAGPPGNKGKGQSKGKD